MNPSAPIAALVSAIVPARNEQASIAACIESLAVQPEIREILVVDDQSTDKTALIVRQQMERFPKLHLLATQELPTGWVGKNYAVWLGACEAQGEWLLFTDADSVHAKDSAAKALTIAAKENAVMVSFSPEQRMETWYEKSLIPYVYFRLANKFSFDDVNDSTNAAAAANGQFLMIRRDVYQAVGGHQSVSAEVLEDVELARRVKGAGYRIWFATGKGIVRVRMYRSFAAMCEGWKKNLYRLMGGSSGGVVREITLVLVPLIAALTAAMLVWLLTKSVAGALCVLLLIGLGISLEFVRHLRHIQFPTSLFWYSIPGRLLFAGVLSASYLSHRKGKLEWKGREYPVGTPGASK
ncbi:MAG: glycosyltransferase [Candidatus Acidiferrum sp.]